MKDTYEDRFVPVKEGWNLGDVQEERSTLWSGDFSTHERQMYVEFIMDGPQEGLVEWIPSK